MQAKRALASRSLALRATRAWEMAEINSLNRFVGRTVPQPLTDQKRLSPLTGDLGIVPPMIPILSRI
jgi:hypothetical protein